MAVPVPPYNYDAENVAANYPSNEMTGVSEMQSLIQSEEECTVQGKHPSVGDFNVESGYKLKKKKIMHIFTSAQMKKCMKQNGRKINTGNKKYLSWLFGRKKSKNQKKIKNSSSKDKKSMNNTMMCLKRKKIKHADFEDIADQDEIEQYHRRSVLPVKIDGIFSQDHTPGSGDAIASHAQDGIKNVDILPLELSSFGDTYYLAHEDDSFRDVHFDMYSADLNLSLSSLLPDPPDGVRLHAGVSRTVEADGLGFETSDVEDDECQTNLKEVVTCKQSASVICAPSKAMTLTSSTFTMQSCEEESNAIQCTEGPVDYTAMAAYLTARVKSHESKNSKNSHSKDESDTKRSVFFKLSNTEPVLLDQESCSQVMSTDQGEGSNKGGFTVESSNQSEVRNTDRSYCKEKLNGLHTTKTETEESHHCTTLLMNRRSLDNFVFQREKCKPNQSIGTNLFTSCCCSRCEYSTTVDYTLSTGEQQKSTSFCTKPDWCQPQKKEPSFSLTALFNFFICGWICCWLDLMKQRENNEGSCKKVSTMLQHHTDTELGENNDKPSKWEADSRQKKVIGVGNCQLVKGELTKDDLNSSDVLEPLQFWQSLMLLVNTKPCVNQSSLTKCTESQDVDQLHPTMGSGNLNIHQLHPGHTQSDQVVSLHKKSKLAQWKKHARHRIHCKQHSIKAILPKSPRHHTKSRTSRRLSQRLNSLEKFIFRQNNDGKTSKHDAGRLDYLHAMPDVESQLNVFMLPFNHPNSQSAVNGTNETRPGNRDEMLGATAGRLTDLENPPSTFNEHISVFEQISTGTVTESMKFEWARFKSFWSFPMSCPILPTTLAKYGFYYTGSEDKVCCFCCGVTHGNWQQGQSVYAIHYQISRRCRFMRGEDVGNVPIHGPLSSLNRRGGGAESPQTAEESELTSLLETPDSITSILLGREQDTGNPITTTSLVQALPTVPSVRSETRNGLGDGNAQNHTETRNGSRVEGASNLHTSNANSSSVSQAISRSPQPVTPVSTPSQTSAVNQPGHGSGDQQTSTAPPTSTVSTNAPTQTASRTATNAPTQTASQTATNAPTQTASRTATNALTKTASQTATNAPTQTASQTATNAPTKTASQTATNAPTQTASQTATNAPTQTASRTATNAPTQTASRTAANAPTQTASRTAANSPTQTSNQAATNAPTQTSNQAHTDTMANQQRPANQQHPTTLAQRQQQRRQEQQQQHGQQQPPVAPAANNPANVGVNTARPRYPNYAVLTVRSSTFNGFPNHLDQTPLQMARAGFFYAGYGDYVRCFFCGGGLRNWEPGDDPWVEHARWFPRCAYVKQNRGQTFINLVLQRQRELTLPNEYINTTTGASTATTQTARTSDTQTSTRDTPPVTSTSPNTTPTANPSSRQSAPTATQRQSPPTVTAEEMKSPAVLNIKDMGYSDEVIKTAIQQLRRNQGPIELSAELLVEILLGFGDEDLPPQRPDQTQTGPSNAPASQTETRNTASPRSETPPSDTKTPEPQTGAASQLDPRPPRRLRNADSSTRSYTEEELKSIQEENTQLKEQMKCKICMDNVVCISFLPCGHLCCCAECAPAMVKCPICRQIIRGSVKTYLS